MTEHRAGRPHPGRLPTHPGAILREDVLPALRRVTAAGEKLGVSRQMLHGILAEEATACPQYTPSGSPPQRVMLTPPLQANPLGSFEAVFEVIRFKPTVCVQ